MARKHPDLIDAYLHWTSGHEGSKKIHRWSIYSVIAGALERKVWVDQDFYKVYPNLYVIIIGKSGVVKKSTSTGLAVDLLRELPDIKLMSDRVTAGSLIDQLGSSKKKFELNGVTKVQTAIYCYASELVVLMKENFGTVSELFTRFWDSPDKWHYKTKHHGEINCVGVCLNLLGASTVQWLYKAITKEEMHAGFAGRILFVVEADKPEKWVARPRAHKNSEFIKSELIEDLTEIYSLTGEMKLTEEAWAFFEEWYPAYMEKIYILEKESATEKKMMGYYSRKGDMIFKLAMIKSASQSSDMVITEKHLHWALNELDLIEAGMREIYSDTLTIEGAYNRVQTPKQIIKHELNLKQMTQDFLLARKRVNRQDLSKAFQGEDFFKVNEILNEMIENGQAKIFVDHLTNITYYEHLSEVKKLQLVT